MGLAKKIMLVVGFLFILIQFIQPDLNKNKQLLVSDISNSVIIPDSIKYLLINTCFDCHSNNTNYPLYAYVQPMGWLMYKHIKDGKEKLNFSDFGSYSKRMQLSLLNGIINSIKDDKMPLASYTLLHSKAKLSANEKGILIKWAQKSKDSLNEKY